MEGTTIWVSEETKRLLDNIKTKSYDEAIKKLIKLSPVKSYVISLTKSVPPETWMELKDNYKEAPFTGTLIYAYIYFPPGCEDLVSIRLGAGSEKFTDWVISGDEKSLTIPLNKDVSKGTPIWAEIINSDTTYSHTPTIEVIIVSRGVVL